ncbi:HpcH/HpaI aldolase family protein [Plantactinospora sonchi]|uniref:Aldolase/citrate lyase family protein n=1 Tax=Plantactinospora sonchi TaxID=1544735 RepID=A0ABU7S0V7_9ACTN
MRENTVKQRMRRGEPVRGVWLALPSVESARLMARTPADWLVVDVEHAPLGAETMTRMVAAIADSGGPAPLVRLANAGVENVKRALDAGAWGVIAPMINTRAEAEAFVAAAKFPPVGQRSFGSAWAGLAFDVDMPDYLRIANEQTIAMVQIENRAALDHLDEIFDVPGLDGVFVGPVDLAISFGLAPDPENPDPRLRRALDEILRVATAAGLPVGIYCSSAEAAAERLQQGFVMVNVATDVAVLSQGVRARFA